MADRQLTIKQEKFKEGMIRDLSGIDAARQAGYKGNSNTLAQRAHELVNNSKIKDALAERRAEIKAKAEYCIPIWRRDTITARTAAATARQWGAVAAFDRLLGQHLGVFELDNKQKAEQVVLDERKREEAVRIANIRCLNLDKRGAG